MTPDGEHQPDGQVRALCLGCGGSGVVHKPRLFVSLDTGEASTMLEHSRCRHCRDDPGHQSGPGFQPPV